MATADGGQSEEQHLLQLPMEVLERIFYFASYDDISNCRLLCRSMDKICQQILNQGFSISEKLHGQIYKSIKSRLPRRESERRSHPLARHMDILAALETRLSLLAMTYIKYMEMGMCCFIPGKVLDEINCILLRIQEEPAPPRPHELLTELRDISSMAMEHFEEKIVPRIKSRMHSEESELNSISSVDTATPSCSSGHEGCAMAVSIPTCPTNTIMNSRVPPLRMEIVQLRNSLRSTSSTVVSLRKEVRDCKGIISDQHKKILEQDKKMASLSHTVTDLKKELADVRNYVLSIDAKLQKPEETIALPEDDLIINTCKSQTVTENEEKFRKETSDSCKKQAESKSCADSDVPSRSKKSDLESVSDTSQTSSIVTRNKRRHENKMNDKRIKSTTTRSKAGTKRLKTN